MTSPAKIIAVGGGKGGIGKSVVSTNLAAGLALSGKKVVLVDTDFGASNLHALIGMPNPQRGFQDFFSNHSKNPNSLLLDTKIRNLKFVSAAGDNPGSANIGPDAVHTILSRIRGLEADMVFLDLGPGTNFNVTDYFNMGDANVVLTTPERTSVMKTFSFVRAALFRRISQKFEGYPKLQRLVDYSDPSQGDVETYTIGLVKEKLKKMGPRQIAAVDSILHSFEIGLVVNRVRRKKDILVGKTLIQLVKKYLEVETKYLGYIIESDQIQDSVEEMVPVLVKDPQSKPSANLQKILGTLTNTDFRLVKKNEQAASSTQAPLATG